MDPSDDYDSNLESNFGHDFRLDPGQDLRSRSNPDHDLNPKLDLGHDPKLDPEQDPRLNLRLNLIQISIEIRPKS